MQDQLILFETAKLAKGKGFNYKVRVYYGHPANPHIAYDKEDFSISVDFNTPDNSRNWKNYISAPTQSLLQRWLREEHKLHIEPWYNFLRKYWEVSLFNLSKTYDSKRRQVTITDRLIQCATYEEALEQGLIKALEEIKLQ